MKLITQFFQFYIFNFVIKRIILFKKNVKCLDSTIINYNITNKSIRPLIAELLKETNNIVHWLNMRSY